jgi:hypothetical protein
MREATDEEVSEFIRRLVPDRLERQKTAIRQALEAADRREMTRSAPQLHTTTDPVDEPATILEGIGREMTPSADGRSLPGAASTEPPPSFARLEKIRRRNLLLAASALTLAVGGVLGFAFGRDEPPDRSAAAAPIPAPIPTSKPAPVIEPVASTEPAASPESLPTEPTPSASAAPARPSGGKRPGGTTNTTTKPPASSTRPPGKGPFVSPIRNPGF